MVAFVRNYLVKKTFEAVLVNFCCYGYRANASEAVQKISTRTMELCQLIKTANFIATPMKKNIFNNLLPAYWRYKPGFCFFTDINKNE